jgi:hypothetical protein
VDHHLVILPDAAALAADAQVEHRWDLSALLPANPPFTVIHRVGSWGSGPAAALAAPPLTGAGGALR